MYADRLAYDKYAFNLSSKRIKFKNANKTKIVASYSNGNCMFLFIHKKQLFGINENKKSVVLIKKEVIDTLKAIPTRDDTLAPHYFKDDKGVYFFDMHAMKLRLTKADVKTFKMCPVKRRGGVFCGKDKKHAYSGDKIIKEADPKSFSYIGWIYARDKTHVFVLERRDYFLIKKADVKTFHIALGKGIDASDENHGYSCGKVVFDY